MSISESVASSLPFLRRYARALTGSQRSGDAAVAAVLEALVAAPDLLDTAEDPRVALYGAFTDVWDSLGGEGTTSGARLWSRGADSSIGAITPRPRQAFLLTAVEGFSVDETARVLRTDPEEVNALVTEAGREIARQVATDVLVIEDEPIIALDLQGLMESLGHRVVGSARTRAEAVRMALARRPGLILADIQLGDGSSGVDAVNEIITAFDVPVVFITAFPERLLTGERPEPAFLITKPFHTEFVKAVVSQALFFDARAGAGTASLGVG